MNMDNVTTQINWDRKRFELTVGESMAFIDFILNKKDVMYLTHTEVPQIMEGKGVGQKIVKDALDYIEKNEYLLAPLCPFVAAYIKRHSEYNKLLAPGFNIS